MSATKEKNSATANCEKKSKYTPPSKKKKLLPKIPFIKVKGRKCLQNIVRTIC